MKIAVIGLGKMGGAIARRLNKSDHHVLGYDPSAGARADIAATGIETSEAVDAMRDADFVITSLPQPETVREVYLGPHGLVHGLVEGSEQTFIEMSTTDPATSRAVATEVLGRGGTFIAAPIGKTPIHAEEGLAPLFLGGTPEHVAKARPVLEAIASDIHVMGDIEQALAFKLVSNLVGMTIVSATAEGLSVLEAAGLDMKESHRLLAGTGADSFQLEARGPMMLSGEYPTNFSIDLAAKDLRLALDTANRLGVPVPTSASALEAIVTASNMGHGAEDVAAVHQVSRRK